MSPFELFHKEDINSFTIKKYTAENAASFKLYNKIRYTNKNSNGNVNTSKNYNYSLRDDLILNVSGLNLSLSDFSYNLKN